MRVGIQRTIDTHSSPRFQGLTRLHVPRTRRRPTDFRGKKSTGGLIKDVRQFIGEAIKGRATLCWSTTATGPGLRIR
jgi:hypothetical protein